MDDLISESFPSRLRNNMNLRNTLKQDYDINHGSYQVMYYNDKYIFIKYDNHTSDYIHANTDKTIELISDDIIILKFDDLFRVVKVDNSFEEGGIKLDSLLDTKDSILVKQLIEKTKNPL